ncbi:unnamed protein product [Cylindrotheca closterium]|uniref:Uncharacterized protein n=1 Tax=Cylindrotheca closterium TaxID=2856 RepID=A0AAD2JIJ8_9STRA|nr:unnamed protein product [Cylindrotheca closterium]
MCRRDDIMTSGNLLWEYKAAETARHSMVKINGMALVLAANSTVTSGLTTLYTKIAILADQTLTITSDSELFFGEDHPSVERRKKLVRGKGGLSLLVVRVTTNDASLSNDAAEIGDTSLVQKEMLSTCNPMWKTGPTWITISRLSPCLKRTREASLESTSSRNLLVTRTLY